MGLGKFYIKKMKNRRTGHLTFSEAKEAIAQLYEISVANRKYLLRTHVLYGYNDIFERDDIVEIPTEEDREYFIHNCKEMIKMPQTSDTLKAELYREIGEFDRCIEYLDTLTTDDPEEQLIRDQIRDKALNRTASVFEIKFE